MKPEKKWQRYTQLNDIWVNMARYRQRITPSIDNTCVLWTGARHAQGYGMVVAIRDSDKKRIMTTTHRVAMRMKLGRGLTVDEAVTHTCGDPRCVNPDHLTLKNAPQLELDKKEHGPQQIISQ